MHVHFLNVIVDKCDVHITHSYMNIKLINAYFAYVLE